MTIPHSRPHVRPEAARRVQELLERGWLAQGAEVKKLEETLETAYPGTTAAAVASGTAALFLTLRALAVGPGKEVLIPSWTCNSVRAAVDLTGARPVPVDSSSTGVTLSVSQAKQRRTRQTAAIVVPHQFGFEADVDGLLELGVPVIEDCAHAPMGRGRDGNLLGTRGRAAVFSFYATKLVPGGCGGAVISRDSDLMEKIARLRNCDAEAPLPGAFNFTLSDIHAALARVHFDALPETLARRRTLAEQVDRVLAEWSLASRADFQEFRAIFFRCLLVVREDLDSVIMAAHRRGVMCARPVRKPLHLELGGNCPRAKWLHEHLLSVPCYPSLTNSEVKTVCAVLSSILSA